MIVGDTHGNTDWLRTYIFPVAIAVKAKVIVVVGDYGAWEHTPAGRQFMNDVDRFAAKARIPLYWLHGNHDKFSHTLATYGHLRDPDGFVMVRENVLYIPQGHAWTWGGKTFRSFGGAYSVDKSWRVQAEMDRYTALVRESRARLGRGEIFAATTVASQRGTLWFPEEEMSDAEMEQLLLDDFTTKDIVLSHDKPMSASPGWSRKNFPACVPNQLRLEQALRRHKPKFWVHGHLHYFYTDELNGRDFRTKVVGLEPDNNAAEGIGWRRENTWLLLDMFTGTEPMLTLGADMELNTTAVNRARTRMAKL